MSGYDANADANADEPPARSETGEHARVASGIRKLRFALNAADTAGAADQRPFLRVFRFADFIADERLFQLRRLGQPVAVQPKVLELLFYLVRHRDRVVSKAELFENLWPHVVVTGASLLYAVKEARKVLGDDASRPRFVINVRARGYRFVAPVEEGTMPRRPDLVLQPSAAQVVNELQRASTQLIGRDDLVASLRALAHDVAAGGAVTLLISGEPGIGKTRVSEALFGIAAGLEMRVLVGRCDEIEGAPPFWPWVQIIRAYLAKHDLKAVKRQMGSRAADIAAIVPELRELWPELEASPAIEDAQARFRVFDAVTSFVRRAAAEQPLVLAIEDLHAADTASLLLLKFVVSQLPLERVLVLATTRSAALEQNAHVAQLASELARREPEHHIELRGLASPAIAQWLQEVGRTPSAELVAQLSELTAGNPLFLKHALHLSDPQALELTGSNPHGAGISDALGRYLSFLSERTRRVLGAASVFGREFFAAPLAAASETDYETVLECLGEAVRFRVLGECPEIDGPYRFTHVLVRDALYGRLGPGDRVRMHRGVGDALCAQFAGGNEPPLAQLAHHRLLAARPGDTAAAVQAVAAAATAASERAAYEEAGALCEHGLRMLVTYGGEPSDRALLEALLARARVSVG